MSMQGVLGAAAVGVLACLVPISTPAATAAVPAGLSRPMVHLAGPATARPAARGIEVSYSSNWSGYAALPKSAGTTFTSVVGSFTVPSVDCATTPNTFSYHWVGLDGWSNATVEQVGVAADCNGTKPSYAAWHEMYPAPFAFAFPVHPGDAVEAAVFFRGGKTYELTLKDVTSGRSFDLDQRCPVSACLNSSAEAITEGYYFDKRFAGTSAFGDEHYATVTVTDDAGNVGAIDDKAWRTGEGIALGRFGDVDTTPGPLSDSGGFAPSSSFSVYWSRQD